MIVLIVPLSMKLNYTQIKFSNGNEIEKKRNNMSNKGIGEDFLKTTVCIEFWMGAVIFSKYVRAEKRKCKDDFLNKALCENCIRGLSEREDTVQWY